MDSRVVHELDSIAHVIRRHVRNDHVPTLVEGLSITAADAPTKPKQGIAAASLAVVAQGRKETTVGGQLFRYSAGECLIVSLDVPASGHITQATREHPYLGFALAIDPAQVADLLLESAAPSTRGVPAGVSVAEAGPDLLGASARLIGLLDEPTDARVLAPVYRREILWRLLTGPRGPAVRRIGLADGNLAHIARTTRWITDHYAEALRVDELAALAGMSASTFHRHFRAVTNTTPIRFQQDTRLHEARRALVAQRGGVDEIAHQVGYDSTSQFSRDYRRRFGEPPGRHAARLRITASDGLDVP